MRKGLKVLLSTMIVIALLLTSVCSVFATHNGNNNPKSNAPLKIRFNDVKENFWAYPAIQTLTDMGIISGFPDKTFKPNECVTRSQFATMLTKALDLTDTSGTQTFVDVPPTSWDYAAVQASHNYLTGYRTSTGTMYFYGGRNAVREDMAVALVRALNVTLVSDNGTLQQVFKDYAEITPSIRDYVYTAYINGIMVGSGDKFKPQSNLTRAEAASLLLRAMQKTEKVPVDDGDKVPVDTTKHTDATLSNLTLNGTTVTGFASGTTTYNVILAAGTTSIPAVAATVHDTGKATVSVTQAAALPGSATVVVTAENGTTKITYTINFTVSATVKHTDATLSNLTMNGNTITGFASGTTVYNVILPAGTAIVPVIAAAVHDTDKATASVTQAPALPGTATVLVTAEDGTTKTTYTVNFSVAPNPKHTDATLSNLTMNGTTITGFASGITTYNVILPADTTAIPVIAATVHDTDKATAGVTQAAALPGSATVLVTAEDGTTKITYTVNFTVAAKSSDALLSSLVIDGAGLTGFDSDTLAYSVVLPVGTVVIPKVTAAVAHNGKATVNVIQAIALPGYATVTVTAEDGTTQKTYTVNFAVAAN